MIRSILQLTVWSKQYTHNILLKALSSERRVVLLIDATAASSELDAC